MNSRNGYRSRDFDARAGSIELAVPKLRSGSYFPDRLLEERLSGLWQQRESYRSWTSRHPDVEARLDRLTAGIARLDDVLGTNPRARDVPGSPQPDRWADPARPQARSLGLDLGR